MKSYELTFLISADLSEEEAKQFQDKVTSLIQTEGGILADRGTILKKKLAYPIKKQIQVFLAILTFQLEPIKLFPLEKKLKLENQCRSDVKKYQKLLPKNPLFSRQKKRSN